MVDETYGGRVYPSGNPEQGEDPDMTLRDYFAGQVLLVMVGKYNGCAATESYRLADAMIAARNKVESTRAEEEVLDAEYETWRKDNE